VVDCLDVTLLAEETAKQFVTCENGDPTTIIGLSIPPFRSAMKIQRGGHGVNRVAGARQGQSEPSPASCAALNLRSSGLLQPPKERPSSAVLNALQADSFGNV